MWRSLVEAEGNIENMDVKQDIKDQRLGKQNPVHATAALSLRDLLDDETPEDNLPDLAK